MLKAALLLVALAIKYACGFCEGEWNTSASECILDVVVEQEEKPYYSPCFGNYSDNLRCVSSLYSDKGEYTQIKLTTFTVESWSDYIKLDGVNTTYFLILADAIEKQLIITGYPVGNFTLTFVSDESISSTGFNSSVSSALFEVVWEQYCQHQNTSAVQVVENPMIVTSFDPTNNPQGRNVLMMKLPDAISEPIAIWETYAGIIAQNAKVNVYDIISDGFSVNWTRIIGAVDYEMKVISRATDAVLKTTVITDSSIVVHDISLPGETELLLNISVRNKIGRQVTLQGHLTTALDLCGDKCTANASCLASRKCFCNEGFVGDPYVYCEAYCNDQEVVTDSGKFTFNSSNRGRTVYSNEKCSGRSIASAVCTTTSAAFKYVSSFASINAVHCNVSMGDIEEELSVTSQLTTKQLEVVTARLEVLTAGTKLQEEDLLSMQNIIEDLETILRKNKILGSRNSLASFANMAANLLQSGSILKHPMSSAETTSPLLDAQIKQQILQTITALAQRLTMPEDEDEIYVETRHLIVVARDSTVNSESAQFSPQYMIEDADTRNATEILRQPVKLTVPASAIARAAHILQPRSSSIDETIRLTFILHKDNALFPSLQEVEPVVGATVGLDPGRLEDLEEGILLEYLELEHSPGISNSSQPLFQTITEYECLYWDFEIENWSEEGCCLNISKSISTCECDHLTNYAMLVSRSQIPEDVALSIICDIGCCLSVLCLVITMIIHCVKKDIRTRRPTQILLHVCANLCFSYLVFVIGIGATGYKASCVLITALLQYLMLASWCWMTVYSNDIYISLVKVFHTDQSHYLKKCAMFGYGLPILATVINAAITVGYMDANAKPDHVCQRTDDGTMAAVGEFRTASAYVSDNMCWLTGYSLYFGFLLPVGLMLVFNIFAFSAVMRKLVTRNQKIKSTARGSAKMNLLIGITLSATTGILWMFGYFMLLSDDETFLLVFSWTFALCNATQGITIFVMTCVRNQSMRDIWVGPLRDSSRRLGHSLSVMRRQNSLFTQSTGGSAGGSDETITRNSTKHTTMKSQSTGDVSQSVM